jgi:pimeloyl-ACP methyl ester carboxylesterase
MVTLAASEHGDGPALVLLHAFPLHAGLFSGVVPRLTGWRVLTPDLRGFGSSPLGDDEPAMAAMADDVVALMDERGIDQAVLGGVSMGGYVAMEMLRRHPGRLRGLLLVDTKAGADAAEAAAGRLATAEAVLREGSRVLTPMLDVLLGPTTRRTRPEVVATVRRWLDEADPATVAWALRAMARRPESFSTLTDGGVPLAAVVGEEDALSPPADAEAMARTRPGSAVLVVPGCGHLAVLEDPALAAGALRSGLASLV